MFDCDVVGVTLHCGTVPLVSTKENRFMAKKKKAARKGTKKATRKAGKRGKKRGKRRAKKA